MICCGASSTLPVALLDDDGYKQGSEIHNVRVMGRIRNLPKVADKTRADLVLLAMPGAPHMVRQAVIAFCASRRSCRVEPCPLWMTCMTLRILAPGYDR